LPVAEAEAQEAVVEVLVDSELHLELLEEAVLLNLLLL
jgi:hypothetical protein